MEDGTTRPIVANGKPVGPKKKGGMLPPALVKEQNDALQKIGIANAINADVKEFVNMIERGDLDFGMFSNYWNKGRNIVGRPTEQSIALSEFTASMERLRNESLRLNSGVQTEGDAQRAWNELFDSLSSPVVVKRQLQRISRLNERAAQLKKVEIDTVRMNAGLEPLDYSSVDNVRPSVGGAEGNLEQDDPVDALVRKYSPGGK